MPPIPKIQGAALVWYRGQVTPGCALHFEQPLDRRQQAIIMGELAALALTDDEMYEPRFSRHIIHLRPVEGRRPLDNSDYRKVAQRLGIEISAELRFGEQSIEDEQPHPVAEEVGYVH